jgi:putative transposase
MGYSKGHLSLRLFHRYEKIGKRFWGRHFWSRGYCVSTVSLDEVKIGKYMNWQENKEKEIERSQLSLKFNK